MAEEMVTKHFAVKCWLSIAVQQWRRWRHLWPTGKRLGPELPNTSTSHHNWQWWEYRVTWSRRLLVSVTAHCPETLNAATVWLSKTSITQEFFCLLYLQVRNNQNMSDKCQKFEKN